MDSWTIIITVNSERASIIAEAAQSEEKHHLGARPLFGSWWPTVFPIAAVGYSKGQRWCRTGPQPIEIYQVWSDSDFQNGHEAYAFL